MEASDRSEAPRARRGWGVARWTSFGLGAVFIAASVASGITQDRLSWLPFTTLLDGIEWGIGGALLLAGGAGEVVARTVLRIIGPVLVLAALLGWVARVDMGDWLGFTIGVGLPGAYAVGFGLTGVAALASGFGGRDRA